MKTVYNIHSQLKNMLIKGYSFDFIRNIYNADPRVVINMLDEIKRDIIISMNEDEYYLVEVINNMICKKRELYDYDNILSLIDNGLDSNAICKELDVNLFAYVIILKNLYLYAVLKGKNEYTSIIKEEIEKISIINDDKKSKFVRKNNIYTVLENSEFSTSNGIVVSNSFVRNVYELDECDSLRLLVISDTHYANLNDNFGYINEGYEYAAKNSIKYILNCGDFIEGSLDKYRSCKIDLCDPISQIDYLFKNYPYDKNISNLILLGNHDLSTLTIEGIDLFDELKKRCDFNPLGYKHVYLKCGNEYITMKHEVNKMVNPFKEEETFLYLVGHKHLYSASSKEKSAIIKCPTLSDVYPNNYHSTGFVDLTIYFENGYAKEVNSIFVPLGDALSTKCLTLLKK